jgi:hypothetical protein
MAAVASHPALTVDVPRKHQQGSWLLLVAKEPVLARWGDLSEASTVGISCPKRLKGVGRLCRFQE